MKMNMGRVRRGYHFISFIAEENGMSDPPVPQRSSAENRRHPADGAKHALAGHQHQHHQREHENRDQFVGHYSGSSLILAMSLMNSDMACSSIKRIPMHMMILIGQSSGLHAVGLRSL